VISLLNLLQISMNMNMKIRGVVIKIREMASMVMLNQLKSLNRILKIAAQVMKLRREIRIIVVNLIHRMSIHKSVNK